MGRTLWDSSGMVGLRGVSWDSLQSLSPGRGWEGLGKTVSWLSTYLGLPLVPGLSTVPGDLKDVQWRQGNSPYNNTH